MRLKSFNFLIGLLIVFFYLPVLSEDKIDIWKNKKEIIKEPKKIQDKSTTKKSNLESNQTIQPTDKIQIQEGSEIQPDEQKVYGIFDPANFDFNLNMWSSTKAEDLRLSLKRLKYILSILTQQRFRNEIDGDVWMHRAFLFFDICFLSSQS